MRFGLGVMSCEQPSTFPHLLRKTGLISAFHRLKVQNIYEVTKSSENSIHNILQCFNVVYIFFLLVLKSLHMYPNILWNVLMLNTLISVINMYTVLKGFINISSLQNYWISHSHYDTFIKIVYFLEPASSASQNRVKHLNEERRKKSQKCGCTYTSYT